MPVIDGRELVGMVAQADVTRALPDNTSQKGPAPGTGVRAPTDSR